MQKLTSSELKDIKGGLSFWAGVGIVGIVLFIVGAIDGFTRPIKCN